MQLLHLSPAAPVLSANAAQAACAGLILARVQVLQRVTIHVSGLLHHPVFASDAYTASKYLARHKHANGLIQMPGTVWLQFGKKALNGLSDRTLVYQQTYGALLDSLKSGDSLRGALFWRWNNEDGDMDAGIGNENIYNDDETYR